MSFNCLNGGDNITRLNNTYFDPTQDWTKCFYIRVGASIPGLGNYRTFWIWGDLSYTNAYVWIGANGNGVSNDLVLEYADGGAFYDSTSTPIVDLNWYYITVTYNAATTTLSFYVNEVLIGTLVHDLSAGLWTEDDEMHGPDNWGDLLFCYERMWQRVLTAAEITAERAAIKAITTTNLLSDSPLPSTSYLGDYGGGSHNWTLNGAPTEYGSPILPNDSGANAHIISSLPFTFVQDTNLETTTTQVYYKYTPVSNGFIGVFGFGSLAVYRPGFTVYSPDAVTVYFDLDSVAATKNRPFYLPVEAGVTYWFTFYTTSGNQMPAVVSMSFINAPNDIALQGDFLTNFEVDNDYEFPIIVLKGNIDYEIRRYKQMVSPGGGVRGQLGLPHGSFGEILNNGNFLYADEQYSNAKVYNKNFNLINTITIPGSNTVLSSGISRILQKFFIGYTLAANKVVEQRDSSGNLENSWALSSVTVPSFNRPFAVNADASILYFSPGGTSQIKRWNLSTNSLMADIVADTVGYSMEGLLYLEDDTILALFFEEATTPRDVYVKQFTNAGVLLNTYNFGDLYRSNFNPPRIGFALDSPVSFWICLKPESNYAISNFQNIRISSGAIISQRNHINYLVGNSLEAETATPLGRFGPEKAFPVLVMPVSSTVRNANSGLYQLTGPTSPSRHDTLTDANGAATTVPIPEPFIETGLLPPEE